MCQPTFTVAPDIIILRCGNTGLQGEPPLVGIPHFIFLVLTFTENTSSNENLSPEPQKQQE